MLSAIKKTLAYAAFFDFPITKKELVYWLISPKPITQIPSIKHPFLIGKLNKKRLQRLKISRQKIKVATKFVSLVKILPTIKMIALTGSLAMDNAKKNDDIDLMIITKPNTLWLTRLPIFILTKLFFNLRKPHITHAPNTICLNLWLDTQALQVPKSKHNLYTAHEVLQVKPLLNKDQTYEQFLSSNSWTKRYLANAYLASKPKFLQSQSQILNIKSKILNIFNSLAFHLQYLYMKNKITSETITLHSAYFHPRSLSKSIEKGLTLKKAKLKIKRSDLVGKNKI